MHFQFVRYRKIFYIVSLTLTVLSVLAIGVFGLKWGIDFTGGSIWEFSYKEQAPSVSDINAKLKELNFGEFSLQRSGDRGFILKTKALETAIHQDITAQLKSLGELDENTGSFESIGPAIGQELQNKTQVVVFFSLLVILAYIAFSFRKISRPVKSYVYGLTSIIALVHDVLIPLGIFALLGRLWGVEVTIPIITAFLTVFGYSINDSVVVFDRVRENLLQRRNIDFDLTVDESLNQTLARSFYTGFTTLLALFAVFFFGGFTLKYFSLALILGIGFGTYSSFFIATLLVVSFYRWQEKRQRR